MFGFTSGHQEKKPQSRTTALETGAPSGRATRGNGRRGRDASTTATNDSHGQSGGHDNAMNGNDHGNADNHNYANISHLPTVSLPKGGGAIRGLGEKFSTNPQTGAASLSVPIPTTSARGGSNLSIALQFSSVAGNGPFGFGWHLSIPSITRKTDKGLPQYLEDGPEDVFVLAGEDDLVPVLEETLSGWVPVQQLQRGEYLIKKYRPRTEGSFHRIERWTKANDHSDIFWRAISRDNITSTFGRTSNSQILSEGEANDGAVVRRIYSWLLSDTYDRFGNAAIYTYQQDNLSGIDVEASHEVNRSNAARQSNRYLKSIKYGNRQPNRTLDSWSAFDPHTLPPTSDGENAWMFTVALDYGDHNRTNPQPDPDTPSPVRADPFSTYRAGFEIRTYRLCHRVLMFHHFKRELHIAAHLVNTVDFQYSESPHATFLTSATHWGYTREADGVLHKKSLPPLEFGYSQPPDLSAISSWLQIHELPRESARNLPHGVDGKQTQWLDLDGEGLPGVLYESGTEWFYKRNVSAKNITRDPSVTVAELGPVQILESKPPGIMLQATELVDVNGDGFVEALQAKPTHGVYARTDSGDWRPFCTLDSFPNVNLAQGDVKRLDVTGDGLPDILVSDLETVSVFRSRGLDGFDAPVTNTVPWERSGHERYSLYPRVPHADASLYTVDLSGDGMPDLARVCNGQVVYYPSLGFGRFGLAVHMANSPVFVEDDGKFEARRLRFADVDGSGTADMLYLGEEGVWVWLNEAGNGWSDGYLIPGLRFERLAEVAVVDLLGKGTGCLVWSERLGCDVVIKYVDLMNGGAKPHLLTFVRNNVGVETILEYRPSTAFYLDDLEAGKPWATKLPLVVHCVARSDVIDRISESHYVTEYAYHHGCFDGVERDFCGFALVERWDTETAFSAGPVESGQPIPLPPVHTKTWYHTGVELGSKILLRTLAAEFFGAPKANSSPAQLDAFIAQTVEGPFYDRRITARDSRDAIRCLKGAVLRNETYSDDHSAQAALPFSISQSFYSIQMIQQRNADTGAPASMMLLDSGHRNEEYDRHVDDPRISQLFNLQYDKWGNALKLASVALGRQKENGGIELRDRTRQGRTVIKYEEMSLTQDIDLVDDYLIRSNCETKAWEVVGLLPENGHTFRFQELTDENLTKFTQLEEVPFEDFVDPAKKQRRLVEWTRTLYRADDLSGFLPFGTIGSSKLLGETYKLALTPGQISKVFKRKLPGGGGQPPEQLIPDPKTVLEGTGQGQGGYVEFNNDGQWWVASGQEFYHENPTATAADELAEARRSCFTVRRLQSPFKDYSTVKYDRDHLLLVETVDSAKNTVTSQNDYRFCQAYLVTDANGNHTEVAFDALGMVVGSAGYGKTTAEGDNLNGFIRHLDDAPGEALLRGYFASPRGEAAYTLLGNATSRFVYDLDRYKRHRDDTARKWPIYTSNIMRETHVSKTPAGARSALQVSFSYSDGLGREAQRKIQGDAKSPDRAWVGGGSNVYNNKGLIFRQYEPFFDDTHEYRHGQLEGPSSTFLYDSLSRNVATLHPDHTWEKTVFTPWDQSTWDTCDTVLLDPQADPDVGYLFKALPSADYQPSWLDLRKNNLLDPDEAMNAQKAEAHANTPTVLHMDSQGRTFLTVADNGAAGKYESRGELNIDGSQRSIEDARGRVVIEYAYDMLGNRIQQRSMESGEGWTLPDAMSRTTMSWDSVGHRIRTFYDALGRSVANLVRKAGQTNEILERKIQYGDSPVLDPAFAKENNLRGQVYTSWDQAGKAVNLAFDFKGHLDKSQRYLAVDYKHTLDWNIDQPLQTRPPYEGSTEIDAMGRSLLAKTADKSAVRYSYNDAGLLEKLEVDVKGDGAGPWKPIVKQITYTVRGSRSSIKFGNGVKTTVEHDDLTRRIKNLKTTRSNSRGATETMQNLTYIYDPVGNITFVKDGAQQDIYFRNQVIEASNSYTYDAVYRLIRATGREHLGQARVAGRPNSPTPPAQFNDFHSRLLHPGDGNAMGLYIESYDYDAVGNIKAMKHDSNDQTITGWARTYTYNEHSQLGGPDPNNRLSSTEVNGTTESYQYDDNGNMVSTSKLRLLQWNHRNQLEASSKQIVNAGTPETTHYVYSEGGQRARKMTESFAEEEETPKLMNEQIYLGAGLQIYREYAGDGTVKLERETLHINDDVGMVCLVESRTVGNDNNGLARLFRFQLVTRSGSVAIEADEDAQVITYEEYTPYGSTSFQGVRNLRLETPKIYRYSGAELDDQTGLSYHGARYYFPILGVWISADPASMGGGVNMYCYAGCNPVMRKDKSGAQWVDIGDDPGLKAAATAADADPRADIANAPGKPSVPTATPPLTLKDARKPAAKMQREVRAAVKKTGINLPSHVFVGHEIPVLESMQSGIANSVRDDPARTMLVNHSRTLGNESGSIDNGAGQMRTLTKNGLQEAHIRDVTARSMNQGGMSHAEAQVNASNQVHYQHENTSLDWRNAQDIVNGPKTTAKERAGVDAEAARIQARVSGSAAASTSGAGGGTGGTAHASSSTTLPSAPHTPSTSSAPSTHGPSIPHAPALAPKPPGKLGIAVGTAATMAESLAPEGFAEAEVALSYASTLTGGAGHATTSLVLGSAAKAVPVVGAAMVAGGVGGYVGETVTSLVSDDPGTIRTGGAIGAMAAGAGIGAAVGAPAGGIGAVPGAIIGGAVGLATYLIGW